MAYNSRGLVQFDLQQYELAIEDFDKTIELDPNFSEAYTNRELARSKMEEQKMPEETGFEAILAITGLLVVAYRLKSR
jgi:tetratricopeptide (TPR) repeat protein